MKNVGTAIYQPTCIGMAVLLFTHHPQNRDPSNPPPPPLSLSRPLSPTPHIPNTLVCTYTNVFFFLLPHYPHLTPSLPLSEYHGPQYRQAQFIKILRWHISLNRRSQQGQFQGGVLGYYCVQIVFVPNVMRSKTTSLQI